MLPLVLVSNAIAIKHLLDGGSPPLELQAHALGIAVAPLSSSSGTVPINSLLLGFGRLPEASINADVVALLACLK